MFSTVQPMPQMKQLQSNCSEVLTELLHSDVNLVIWQRDITSCISDYAAALSSFAGLQLVAEPDELNTVLQQRLPKAEGKAELIADLELLSQMLCCLMDCTAVGLRLKRLDKAMCPRFHTDHVAARLLVTYSGPGTEWHSGTSAHSQHSYQQIRHGDVAVLKGSGWYGNKDGAIWHRSPQTNQPRLLLSLDPVGE
ncbi:DUF1826 domain-containing protein [Rheinheimera sp.]|uniref:DUF1826 domain-containing protein n=1 Tax=Rheinheimera sp. TaxID=1869214 RepID=UPI002FDDC3CB